jgi:hypothetical protein
MCCNGMVTYQEQVGLSLVEPRNSSHTAQGHELPCCNDREAVLNVEGARNALLRMEQSENVRVKVGYVYGCSS